MVDEFNEINSRHEFGDLQHEYFKVGDNETAFVKEQAKINESGTSTNNSKEEISNAHYSYDKQDSKISKKKTDLNFFQKIISLFLVATVSVPIIGELILSSGKVNLLHLTPSYDSVYYELELVDYEGSAYINLYNDFINQINELTGEVVIENEGTPEERKVVLCYGSFTDLKPEMTYNVDVVVGEGLSRTVKESKRVKTLKVDNDSQFFEASVNLMNNSSLLVRLSYEDRTEKWEAFKLVINYDQVSFEHTLSKEYEQSIMISENEFNALMGKEAELKIIGYYQDNEELLYSNIVKFPESSFFGLSISNIGDMYINVELDYEDSLEIWDSFKLVFIYDQEEFAHILSKDYSQEILCEQYEYEMLNYEIVSYQVFAYIGNDETLIYSGEISLNDSKLYMFYISEYISDNRAFVEINYNHDLYNFEELTLVLTNTNITKEVKFNPEEYNYEIDFSENEIEFFIDIVTSYVLSATYTDGSTEELTNGEVTFTYEESQIYYVSMDQTITYDDVNKNYYVNLLMDYVDPANSFTNLSITFTNNYIEKTIDIEKLSEQKIYFEESEVKELIKEAVSYQIYNVKTEVTGGTHTFNYEGTFGPVFNSLNIDNVLVDNQLHLSLSYEDNNSEWQGFRLNITFPTHSQDYELSMLNGEEQTISLPYQNLEEINNLTINCELYAVPYSGDEKIVNTQEVTLYAKTPMITYFYINPEVDDYTFEISMNLLDTKDEVNLLTLTLVNQEKDISIDFELTNEENQQLTIPEAYQDSIFDIEFDYTVVFNDETLYSDKVTFENMNSDPVFTSMVINNEITDEYIHVTLNYEDKQSKWQGFKLELVGSTASFNFDLGAMNGTEQFIPITSELISTLDDNTFTCNLYADNSEAQELVDSQEVTFAVMNPILLELNLSPLVSNDYMFNIYTNIYDKNGELDEVTLLVYNTQEQIEMEFTFAPIEEQELWIQEPYQDKIYLYEFEYELSYTLSNEKHVLTTGTITFEEDSSPRLNSIEIGSMLSPIQDGGYTTTITLDIVDYYDDWTSLFIAFTDPTTSEIIQEIEVSNAYYQDITLSATFDDYIDTAIGFTLYNKVNNETEEIYTGTITFQNQ